jgi:hypothetical protein
MASVERDMRKAIPTQFDIKAGIVEYNSEEPLNINSSGFSVSGFQKTDTSKDIIQNITIHSTSPLTASEIARQIKNASRQMALEW